MLIDKLEENYVYSVPEIFKVKVLCQKSLR